MKECDKWPLYSYAMELLTDEEWALASQSKRYNGSDAGFGWIYLAAKKLMNTYYP